VRYVSATASARIGGDLYEITPAAGGVRLIVADVQGQGLAAAQTAAVVLGAFREAAYDAPGLTEVAARIELSLQRRPAEEEFVTAVLAEIPARGLAVTILNCGHPPPVLVSHGEQHFIETASPGLPLGLEELLVSPRETTVSLRASGRILFYTDGISEARDSSGQFYPLERCASLLAGYDLDAALDHLRDDVVRYGGHHLLDDAAMLLIGRDATAACDGPAAGISWPPCAPPQPRRPLDSGRPGRPGYRGARAPSHTRG